MSGWDPGEGGDSGIIVMGMCEALFWVEMCVLRTFLGLGILW